MKSRTPVATSGYRLPGELPRMEVHPGELGVVVEHLLEVGTSQFASVE